MKSHNKKIQQMGLHSDNIYRKHTSSHVYKFSPTQNLQSANTPTVVLSAGDQRTINFHEPEPTGKIKIKSGVQFKMNHGSCYSSS